MSPAADDADTHVMDRYTKLKPHRKRSGLTQREMAFLLGNRKHSTISRYEAGERRPDLRTAFACRVLFGRELQELFPGVYAEAVGQVGERARLLSDEIRRQEYSRKVAYKLKKLAQLQREGLDGSV
jgi:transcriptional regulator with XRE-family HTH domain